MMTRLMPNLMVDDVNETIDFYEETMGCFEVVLTDPAKGKFDWALMRCGDVELMFQSRKSLAQKIPELEEVKTGGGAVIYIEAEDVEGLYDWLSGKVEIIKELHDTQWGRKEFFMKDCNGYILVFAQ